MTVVAVIDTTTETLEILQGVLEDEGYTVPTAYTVDFKRNTEDLPTFFRTHHPQAVVYDIALPYEKNWAFFCEHILASSYLPEHCFVLTTTNTGVLEVLVGSTHAIELVSRPFDLDLIVASVRRALAK